MSEDRPCKCNYRGCSAEFFDIRALDLHEKAHLLMDLAYEIDSVFRALVRQVEMFRTQKA